MDKQARQSFVSHEADEIYDKTNINECLDTISAADEASRAMKGVLYHDMVGVAVNVFSSDGDLKLVRDVFRAYEEKYKRASGVKSMPNAYRSCKSAVLNALKYNISLHNDDGTVHGKTAIEELARQARRDTANNGVMAGESVISSIRRMEYYTRCVKKFKDEGNSFTTMEKQRLRDIFNNLHVVLGDS